jgi:protein-S-isoprenylcysteine O-methyltransferase
MNLPPLSIVSVIWGAAELGLAIKTHSESGARSKDQGSLFSIWIVCGVSVWLGIWLGRHLHSWEFPARHAAYLIGYALFVVGVVFRWASIIHLGRFFTPNVTILNRHRLIETGPYRLIRHPTYTGALVAAFGVTLTMGNLASLLVICVPIAAVVLWRIRIEEAALLEAFGDQYRSYMSRTKRLIPLMY